MMSCDVFPPIGAAVPALAAVRAIVEVRRAFAQLRPAVRHSLRVTSAAGPHGRRTKHGQARIVPSVWGCRRDDYRWDKGTGTRHDVVGFRAAATAAATVLVHHPLAVWSGVLPGTMADVMGTRSDLYLADYWVLVLHHLVWTGRLPYPVHAQWTQGDVAEPGPYHFVSELPTDLAEASREALILLEESAVASLNGNANQRFGDPDAPVSYGLPSYHHGRWELSIPGRSPSTPDTSATPAAEPDRAGPAVAIIASPAPQPLPPPSPPLAEAIPPVVGSGAEADPTAADLTLDDQTFTVRYGTASHRFPPRGKLLFALLERVARRPGHRVGFDDLRTIGDVWDGSQVEDSTVRGAVARLRGVLEDHGMGGLAARIQTGTYRNSGYVLLDVPGTSDSDV